MFVLVVLVAICFIDRTITAVLEKPVYDLENAENLFEEFIREHEKSYNPNEYKQRLEIFKDNLKEINERNAMHPHTVFAVNHFSDFTAEEWQQYQGFKAFNSTPVKIDIPDFPLPAEFDWREKGVVSPIQDQRYCRSCYIFSAIGNIEGQYALKHKQCLDLSESQTLDCLKCATCDGGIIHKVMEELAERAGIETEADYPYKPTKGKCLEKKSQVKVHVKGGKAIEISDEIQLQKTLVHVGPLAVAIASQDMHHYHGGILHPADCIDQTVDHGVLLVGYGEENGIKYWTIKNSWGRVWGEAGYFRLQRGVNACEMGTSYTATADVA